MKSFSLFFILVASLIVNANNNKDPNLKNGKNKSVVATPGCTEFVHPCSGQLSTAALNATTNPVVNKASGKTSQPGSSSEGPKIK